MQNNNKRAVCKAHPIAWLVQQRLLHPLTKKSLASEELARLLKWRFKMDLNQRPPD